MGFKGVEIFENDFLVHDLKPKEIKKIVSDYGLQISLFQPFRDFEGMPEPYRSRAFDRAKKKFDIMNELGAKTILVCSNTSNLAVGGIDRAADDFNELGEIAKNRKSFARLASTTEKWVPDELQSARDFHGDLSDTPEPNFGSRNRWME